MSLSPAPCSPFFFFSLPQVELVGTSYCGLKAVVDFMYSGELPLNSENVNHVLETAHLLQVREPLSVR